MKQEDTFRWDDGLDGPALEIAELNHGPIRVVAGPGTGKTYALMRRVARLLQEGAVAARILLCTFTRTAAEDLSRELTHLRVGGVDDVEAGTLHSFCYAMLMREEVLEATGRTLRTLMDFEETLLKHDLKLELKQKGVASVKECDDLLKAAAACWAKLQSDNPGWATNAREREFEEALFQWLMFHKAMLIGELIPKAFRYLRHSPLSPYLCKFDHVLVDEYQDLNRAEQDVLSLLAKDAQIVVVGDEDQSIYGFRHARPEGIAEFHLAHDGTRDVPLDLCRRCPPRIITLANELIRHNKRRKRRQLKPFMEDREGVVHILQWPSLSKEANGVAKFIRGRIQGGDIKPGGVLVLAPRREIGYRVRKALNAIKITAHSFFREEELENDDAKKALCLLTLLAKPNDRVALRCWCGLGSQNKRSGSWMQLRRYCEANGLEPRKALDDVASGELEIPYARYLAAPFKELQAQLKKLESLTGPELLDTVLPSGEKWADPLRKLVSDLGTNDFGAAELSDGIRAGVIQRDMPTDVDYVRVMSLHKSKGLTADLVVVVGCVEGILPISPTDSQTDANELLEEQRRLFYVAITRAKRELVMSSVTWLPRGKASAMNVQISNKQRVVVRMHPSRFVHELGPDAPKSDIGEDFLRKQGYG